MESTRMERLLIAIVAGRSQDSVGGLKDAKERLFWDNVTRQVAEAIAAGYVIEVPSEMPDWYDSGLRVKDEPTPASKAMGESDELKSMPEEPVIPGSLDAPVGPDVHHDSND